MMMPPYVPEHAGCSPRPGRGPQRWLPQAEFVLGHFPGNLATSQQARHLQRYGGTLPEQIIAVERYIESHMERGFSVEEGPQRRERPQFPPVVLREMLVNAAGHRDYSLTGASVRVSMFPNRIEVASPGGPPVAAPLEGLMQASHARNRIVMRLLWQVRFCEAFGLGLRTIILSGKQVMQSDLMSQINAVLRETSLDDRSLKLEIAAETIVDHVESVTALLLRMRIPSLDVYIDDFGAGSASLAYLHRYPIDSLKIDRCFVAGLDTDESNVEIVRSIVARARKLGIGVGADGVETREQLACLHELGCDRAQGYLISPPLEAEAVAEILQAAVHSRWWIDSKH